MAPIISHADSFCNDLSIRKSSVVCCVCALLISPKKNKLNQLTADKINKTKYNNKKYYSEAASKPQGYNRELEKQIVDKILGEGYDKRIRPSGINNKTGQDG